MWQAWVNGILGIWLIIAAFLIGKKAWQGWTAVIFGIWLVIAAFIPSLQAHTGNLWNDLIVGIIIAIAGFGALGKNG
ncbi:hypothetical protein B6D60_04505 [candidate division KSB1 bacterium 4484_87]|nr:MAG: hypothetical protein B6D60_04505 [candidate division KSB1 bacterium 4484_87]